MPWHQATPELDDAAGRARLARALSAGVGKPRAFVLPLQAWNARDGRRWISEDWKLRRERLYLASGDSPAGFRLPLGSLPALHPLDYPHVVETDPTLPRPPLLEPDPRRQPFLRRAVSSEPSATEPRALAAGESTIDGNVRTALVLEPRNGRLCVFLPPLEDADAFVDLVATVEDVAAETGSPVHLEGYPPPRDPRLRSMSVTPDPGVVEVNIPPARSWRELCEITETVYEEARLTRLGTEKFMLDGRHSGTGGGNHVVLGGATPADSPFLRRPDLLRSLVAYWLNHPSLSYLFSGLFIGPTSQSPRIDEARQDALYELELAFAQLPEPGESCPPWLVDRVLRHLLVDVTGNTHRAEFCIDKLYSPDTASGRQGLVELRSFEMPPHPRMSLAQQLLVRALVAWFWREPYARPLVRHGTALHDRYLLPHFVREDFRLVLADLARAGLALDEAWFGAHFEFRFPEIGGFCQAGVEVEIRRALEPWHVLGEEGAVGGTARFVDSSLERVEVRARGVDSDRYRVACNGVRVPLVPTDRAGEGVCGVRFRAWQPARALHPTIPVHSPLTFEVVDGRERAIARRGAAARRPSRGTQSRALPRQRARGGGASSRALRALRPLTRHGSPARHTREPRASAHPRPASGERGPPMSELLALSFDADASPRVAFEKRARRSAALPGAPPRIHGWGIGWYPSSERGASLLKDPGSGGDAGVGERLVDWERFRSTVFVAHLRGHRRRRSQQDLQPFVRTYGGRQWIFAHDGDLERGLGRCAVTRRRPGLRAARHDRQRARFLLAPDANARTPGAHPGRCRAPGPA